MKTRHVILVFQVLSVSVQLFAHVELVQWLSFSFLCVFYLKSYNYLFSFSDGTCSVQFGV